MHTLRKFAPWLFGGLIVVGIVGLPILSFRLQYTQAKRLREVVPGKLYRSGQMTADSFREAIRRYGIRTVINLQSSEDEGAKQFEDLSDPRIAASVFGGPRQKESDVVTAAGARYLQIDCNSLDKLGPRGYPAVLDDVYEVFDDERNYPILVHCKAGLHRTGLVVAAYRMEYEGRSRDEALDELKANGFGDSKATDANAYIHAGITLFERRPRGADGKAIPATGGGAR